LAGSVPTAIGEHLPTLPATLHARHRPVHEASQHTPSTQNPDAHSPAAAQVAPVDFLGTQPVPLQKAPKAQSALVAQAVRHAPAPHANGSHDVSDAARQVPAPSHTWAPVSVLPLHMVGAQLVPDGYRRHDPVPSHVPSVPQVGAPTSLQWFSGSWPVGTFTHDPAEPDSAHDLHVWSQSVAQQTPCAQKPESQSDGAAHATPTGFLPQLPFTHIAVPRHSLVSPHAWRQSPFVPHRYGEHDCDMPATQVPFPSQREASTRVNPVGAHVCGRQIVPD